MCIHRIALRGEGIAGARLLRCIQGRKEGSPLPVYTIRTNKGDEDVDEILARIPASSRSWYIKEAVRFYAGAGSELKKLSQNIERLMSGAVMAAIVSSEDAAQSDNSDDMLMMGILDILK